VFGSCPITVGAAVDATKWALGGIVIVSRFLRSTWIWIWSESLCQVDPE
jgi:hypothetical protein